MLFIAVAGRICACSLIAVIVFLTGASAQPFKPELKPHSYKRYTDEIACLAQAIYFEARGEPVAGQRLVADVILNRVANPYYPKSACAVVYQNSQRPDACQFSFACDGVPERISDRRAFSLAELVAKASFRCNEICRFHRGAMAVSTHYHADSVSPGWASKLRKTGQIGRHVFYFTATM